MSDAKPNCQCDLCRESGAPAGLPPQEHRRAADLLDLEDAYHLLRFSIAAWQDNLERLNTVKRAAPYDSAIRRHLVTVLEDSANVGALLQKAKTILALKKWGPE